MNNQSWFQYYNLDESIFWWRILNQIISGAASFGEDPYSSGSSKQSAYLTCFTFPMYSLRLDPLVKPGHFRYHVIYNSTGCNHNIQSLQEAVSFQKLLAIIPGMPLSLNLSPNTSGGKKNTKNTTLWWCCWILYWEEAGLRLAEIWWLLGLKTCA